MVNNHGQTKTVTSTNSAALASHTKLLTNGTLLLLTRTDVNEAGTVTATIENGVGQTTVLSVHYVNSITLKEDIVADYNRAYPTPYFAVNQPIKWSGLVTHSYAGNPCCIPGVITSATPSHYPFPSSTGSTNSNDPTGWLYALASWEEERYLGSERVSSLFAPANIKTIIESCPHTRCPGSSSVEPMMAASIAGGLLKTSTVHVTDHTAAPNKSPGQSPAHNNKPPATPAAAVGSTHGHYPTRTITGDTSDITATGPPAPIVVGSNTLTANAASQYVVSGKTLVPGTSITIGSGASAVVVALTTSASNTLLIVGSSTSTIGARTGIGNYIINGLGDASTTPSATVVVQNTSGSRGLRVRLLALAPTILMVFILIS